MIINTTESYCFQCRKYHEADLSRHDGKVFFTVYCPKGKKVTQLSHDYETFTAIRNKNGFSFNNNQALISYAWKMRIDITNRCNFNCPVCYADAGTGKTEELSLNAIREIALKMKKRDIPTISLTGGEPTIYKNIFKAMDIIKSNKLKINIVSNGYILGKQKEQATLFKRHGVNYFYIQFDSFKREVLLKLRGKDALMEKERALGNLKDEKIKFATITTVTGDNIYEVGDIARYAATFSPSCSMAVFIPAVVDAGRFEMEARSFIDREYIVKTLIETLGVDNLTVQNFWPLPKVLPLRINLHPDCLTLLFLAVINGDVKLFEDYFNIEKFFSLLKGMKQKMSYKMGLLIACFYFIRSAKIIKIISLMKIIFGLITKKGKSSLFIIAVEQYMSKDYMDKQRIDHCTTRQILDNGEEIPICLYYHPQRRK